MSESNAAPAAATEPQATSSEGATEQQAKPTETVDFWKQKAREQEKRAKENATAAQRLAEIEDSQRSEAEKAQARIADLEKQLTETQTASTRLRIASEHGITDADDIDLFLTGSDEETLTKQAKRLADRAGERKQTNTVTREGATTSSSSAAGDDRDFVRNLFGSE